MVHGWIPRAQAVIIRRVQRDPPGDPTPTREGRGTSRPESAESDTAFLSNSTEDQTGRTSTSEWTTHVSGPNESTRSVAPAEPGQAIGGYRLVGKIAAGGMGEVWEAFDARLRRTVALKLIRPDRLANDDMARRFTLESQVQARLQHDAIAQVYEADAEGPQPFMAMELVRGAEHLDRYVESRRLTLLERLDLLRIVADAMEYAHRQGVIHLDLKPSNVLVRADGSPKVVDFGGGRLTDSAGAEEEDDHVPVVTPAYMSPEQASLDAQGVDARTDVYALGVIAYQLITGRLPYDVKGRTFSEVRDLISGPTPPAPLDLALGGANVEVRAVMALAIAKSADERYQSAGAFRDDLRGLVNGHPISAVTSTLTLRARRWLRQADRVPWAGRVLSGMAWFTAALCAWFAVVAVAFPSMRDVLIPGVQPMAFAAHEGMWVVGMFVLGIVARRAGRGAVPAMWTTLIASVGLAIFTVGVATGTWAYDAAGAVSDPQSRAMVFTLTSTLSTAAVIVSVVMLLSHYERAPWRVPPRTTRARR